jgi:3-hydroxyisobutyrate dehydrogenase
MAQRETVAVLGAGGTMGFPIARNLARAGFDVRAWNRSREKAEPLADDGVTVFDALTDAARGAGVVVTMLTDADVVLHVMDGPDRALAGVGEGAIWLQMSTIGITGTERCAALAVSHRIGFVDAPVLGTKAPAEAGELIVLASGRPQLRPRVDPIFDAIGKRTLWVGEAGAGTRLKIVTNSWVVALVETAAETIALAEGIGVDPRLFLDAIDGGPLDLPYLDLKGRMMIERDFEPSFRLALAAKDAGLVAEAAERGGLDLPVLDAIRRRLDEAAAVHGDEDLAATFLLSAPRQAPA